MASNGKFSVAIIGAGATGLALAVSLRNRGFNVQIFEKRAALDESDAGFLLNPSAFRALRLCNISSAHEIDTLSSQKSFSSSSTAQPERRFLFLDGFHSSESSPSHVRLLYERIFPSDTALVNRKEFLQALSTKLPSSCLKRSKCLVSLTQPPQGTGEDEDEDGQLHLAFEDGSKTSVDAVVGCDGVTSKVRQLLLGQDHPAARATYANQYSYRLHVAMEDAIKIVGIDRATSNCVYLGLGKRFITTPSPDGRSVQLVALCYDKNGWSSDDAIFSTATSNDVLSLFAEWVQPVQDLIRYARPQGTRWAVFDQVDHFPPTFAKGRVCLAGDAAHAMTPHLGTSLSADLGDVVLLTELFSDRRVKLPRHLAPAMEIYSKTRHPRALWLVQSSRRAGLLYFWLADEARGPEEDGRSHILALHEKAWSYEINVAVASAKQELGSLLRRNEAYAQARRAGVSQEPFNEMLGMYDYYDKARQGEP